MVSTCEDHFGFKVRVRGKSKFFVRMTKRALPKVRVKGSGSIKAGLSMTLKLPDTLFGGDGNSSQMFGSSGDTANTLPDFILPINFVQNFGGLLPRPMRVGSALKVRVTPVTIKRAITNVSPSIFDITSAEYIQSGDAAIPDSVYIPSSFNNSTGANNVGPKIYWNLQTSQVRTQNFKFRASAGVPVNNFKVKLRCEGKIRAKYFEKLHGFVDRINAKDDYVPTEKIVPIKDIEVASNTIAWVNETLESGNLYQSINEGVSVGNIVQNGKRGSIISDDDTTFITPSSIYTASKISYKCEVTRPSVNPIESYFFLRASAPIRTNESDVPPEYKISNIKYEDPSGNLIAKYKDFVVKGEQDYSLKDQYSFVTYISETDINYGAFNSWEYYHPILDEPDGYTLSFDIENDCHYKPFTKGFTEGFLDSCNIDEKFVPSSRNDYLALDGSPLSTHTDDYYLKPSDSIRISAIELANIGTSSGIFHDQKVHMLLKAPEKLTLVERIISPTQVLNSTYSNDIHPTNIISTWKSSADIDGNYYYNEDKKSKSTSELTDRLSNRYVEGDITLDNISPVADSGKLQLLYEHKKPFFVKIPQGGATNSAFVNNDFQVAQIEVVQQPDSFFVIEEIFLRIKAKKAVGTNDFSIDVVGYSDDDITIKTPEVGGFLQNSEVGAGTIPEESGFYRIDELGISSFPSSEKSSYYQRPVTENPAGDHYKLTPSIYKVTKGSNNQETKTASLINSTSYAEYEVPLKIYKDKVELGSSLDYSMSTYFESLYLDIYPIPSGASISKADIIVKYSPAHALAMYTMGYDKKEIYKRDAGLIVSEQKSVDTLMNLSGVALSQLDNIPHAYSTKESTLKTNYSRRWRGSSGNLRSGAFDSTQFGYAFENPQAIQPFTLGYYDINKTKDDAILSNVINTSLSGVFSHDRLSDSITKNIGMRFDSDHLFSDPVRSYKSIDWTYDGDPLHGKILDAFDNVVRVSGVDGYINFGNVPTASGFAIFTRFSPDVTISGVDYNLWNSGVLFQKQDSGQNLEYGLKYNNGSLQAFARDNVGNTISVEDTANYDEYQYPLSVAVTYNAGQNKKLKLYAANEIIGSGTSDWPILRGESSTFVMHSGDSDLTFGYSKNNGAGLNAFISEIGISNAHPSGGANLVDSNANPSYQQDSIYDFFDGHVVKFWKDTDPTPLWKFVDEDTDTWKLGAFKYCEFGRDFSIMTHRSGKDFISHKIYNDNKTYDQITDLAIPSNINVSGLIYHTQIENDMLRFHLDGREDRYFSTPPRLVKDLPRGYLVDGDALEVNTVIQHFADNDILWPDGNTGAKLIVSLYTPNKESVLFPSVNYGLINRSTHYLNPKDCWNKISSRLSLNDIKDDTSEPWAFFDKTITSKELKENYFARDIDQMFVQYDLLYPSGHYTESEIILHSVDVKLNEAILTEEVISDRVLLETSGDAFSTDVLHLETNGKDSVDDVMWITTSGDNYTALSASGWLNTLGSGLGYEEFALVTKGIASIWQTSTASESGPIFAGENFGSNHTGCPDNHSGIFDPDWGIYVSGCYNSITDTYNCTHLRMSVLGGLDSVGGKLGMSTISNNPDATSVSGVLSLYAYDDQAATTSTTLALATYSDLYDEEFDVFGPIESPDERELNASLNLFIRSPDKPLITKLDTSCNMFVHGRKPAETATSDLGLFLYHYSPIAKKEGELESFDWDGQNNGVPIDLADNELSSVTADDNIRGVTTVCYGDCDSNSNTKCFELPVITHDTLWYEPECATGGVVRGLRTYSNPNDKAFGSDEPYSNHYYAMRKFQNLIPYALYDIVVHARTGSDKIADVPREIDTWEYGIKNTSTGNDNENVNYSGISIIPPQNNIAQNQKFGSAIDVCDDMIFIGSPFENLQVGVTDPIPSHRSKYPSTYELEECGKIYVYKKDPAPSGYDWSNQSDKSGYQLHQEIVLPEYFRRDTFTTETKSFVGLDFKGTVSNWQNLGEGRRLGSSIATSKINNKKMLATGGTGSKWSRTFDTISPSPVKIGMFVFNNEIEANPRDVTWTKIVDELKNRDLLYRYFCDPSVEFSIKIILLEPLLGGNFTPEGMDEFNYPQPDFVTSHLVHRHFNTNPSSVGYQDREDVMFNELKEIFHEEFPLSSTELNSGIPALMGIYIDDSRSLGKAAVGAPTDFRRNAIGRFQDYYNQYGYDNGLEYRSSNQMGGGGPAYGYSKVTIDTDEDWITQSINCLQDLTDVDNLKDTNTFRIFADSLGTFNSAADEFNNPPPSGGAVYIFEEDDNNQFNLVQQIQSPTTNTENPSDRFGHSLAFSDDGKVLAVGSPYCESPFRVYQYNESFLSSIQTYLKSTTSVENFLKKRRDYEVDTLGVFEEGYNLYTEFLSLSGSTARDVLNQSMYDKFSDSMKFLFLEEYNITPYRLIKDVSYNSIVSGGWGSLYSRYVPTSRIGYSVDVNKDGSLIAVGCPTDSLGERDDLITWFRYDQKTTQSTGYGGENWQWQNYTNAGCVRLYESRDYYPHDRKVVEYYKFGNLHEIIETEENGVDPQYFTQAMKTLYNGRGYSFERTSFSEDKEIPQDAGLAFIITPSVNAGSSEVIDNIKNWLALGDRHLVLVGNDPRWEASGRYAVGNDILNSILGQLDIKMRLYATRNEFEALMTNELYYNVRASFIPGKTMSPIATSNVVMRGSGVADIRFYDEGRVDLYNCQMPPNRRNMSDPFSILENVDGLSAAEAGRKKTYRELHSQCNLPIIHEGDLRAEYTDQCIYRDCKGNSSFVNYKHNLAYMFGTHTTASWGCTVCDEPPIYPVPINERSFSEPIPILSAWETVNRTYTTDEVPASEGTRKIITGYNYDVSSYKEFGSSPYDSGIDFAWTATSGDPVIDYNLTDVNSDSLFFDPESYNGRDSLLMAGSTSIGRSTDTIVTVKNTFVLAAEENLGSSKVYLVASNLFQDRDFNVTSPNDELLDFYFNILANDQFGSSRVAQLGGFTNRSSYKEGYIESNIEVLMGSLNINMEDVNVDPYSLRSAATPYDVAWITNTTEYPSAEDIESLKIFLSNPSKKLIITYGEHPNKEFESSSTDLTDYMVQAANVAAHICSELGLDMKPLHLPSKNRFASFDDVSRQRRSYLYIDQNSSVSRGFGIQRSFPAKLTAGGNDSMNYESYILLPPYGRDLRGRITGRNFYHNVVPIDTGSKAQRIAYFTAPIKDDAVIEDAYPQFYSGLTKVTFQIPERKSYHDDYNIFRIFFGYSSESEVELNPIEYWITNCQTALSEPEDFATSDSVGSLGIKVPYPGGYDTYNDKIGAMDELGGGGSNLRETFVDVQFPSGESEFSIYFKAKSIKPNAELPSSYSTNRLFHVSGARVPVATVTDVGKVPIYDYETYEIPGIPSETYEVTRLREISTDSSKYCTEANSPECLLDKPVGYGSPANEIADGPVVMAQQVYHQAGYLAGDNKSRVTVIADASLIQGNTITVEGSNNFNSSVGDLLASLYPASPQSSSSATKQYELSYKIVSPERSSPSRLINAYPDNSGLNYRFGEHDSNSLSSSYFSDDEGKKRIIPYPGNDFVSQPFDGMLGLLSAEDTGKFRKLPEPPRMSPSERFALMEPKPEAGIAAQKAMEQAWYVDNFKVVQQYYASNSKLTDTYKGVTYSDAGYLQIIPDIMKAHDIDHLDLDIFISGYPGDLFGYCVKIDNNDNLYASSPFTPYSGINTVSWDKIKSNSSTYGQEVGYNGGAGAVYVLKRQGVGGNGAGSIAGSKVETTGIPWEVTSKIRPEEIKVGFTNIDSTNSVSLIGPNSYSDDFLKNYAFVPDMFGADMSIEGDVLSISAPGHDFDVVPEEKPGAFVRKEFNNQFNIGTRVNHDLATPSGFNEYATSGTSVINNGAVFTYENKIDDWGAKTQNWVKVQKLVYGEGRVQGSGENLFAGQDISMDRARRTDADYILAFNATNHLINNLDNVGSVYTNDGMLRKLRPSFAHPETYISGRVFGDFNSDADIVNFKLANGLETNKLHKYEGRILATQEGEVFIEVSGQDKIDKGYVIHRPYVEKVEGAYAFGISEFAEMPLFVEGKAPSVSGNLNLVTSGDNLATHMPTETNNVYNSLLEEDIQNNPDGVVFLVSRGGRPKK